MDRQQCKNDTLKLLKTAKGHIDGLINMVNEEQPCIEVSKQMLAVQGLIKKANMKILEHQIRACLENNSDEAAKEANVNEIMTILDKYYKY